MKCLLSFIICFCSLFCSAQKPKLDSIPLCSDVLNELSYYWKLDSLANNGFRLYTVSKLLKCRLDSIDKQMLLSKFGPLNSIREINFRKCYRYYYFDILKMPKNFDGPEACLYISFNFDLDNKYIFEIVAGDMDR
jgi:hypothetical protein